MRVSFKEWIKTQEGLIPGTYHTRTQDLTNTGLGVRSKYLGPDDTGEKANRKPLDIADFGFKKKKPLRRSNV